MIRIYIKYEFRNLKIVLLAMRGNFFQQKIRVSSIGIMFFIFNLFAFSPFVGFLA